MMRQTGKFVRRQVVVAVKVTELVLGLLPHPLPRPPSRPPPSPVLSAEGKKNIKSSVSDTASMWSASTVSPLPLFLPPPPPCAARWTAVLPPCWLAAIYSIFCPRTIMTPTPKPPSIASSSSTSSSSSSSSPTHGNSGSSLPKKKKEEEEEEEEEGEEGEEEKGGYRVGRV